MGDIVVWLNQHFHEHHTLYFIGLYILGGKPTALITARLFGLNLPPLISLVIVMDAVQIPFFYFLYGHVFNYGPLSRLSDRLQVAAQSCGTGPLSVFIQSFKRVGLVLFTVIPCKGFGLWTGVFFARLMGLSMREGFPLLIAGTILACLMYAGLGEALMFLWEKVD
jgi:hypothetical protein